MKIPLEHLHTSMQYIYQLGDDAHHASPVLKYATGLITGGFGSAMANPFDLVKTRFQATLPEDPIPYNNSVMKAFNDIAVEEGVYKGLYK